MRQPVPSPRAPPQLAEDVERIRRLFDASVVSQPLHHQQCERELLVGGSLS